VIGALGPREQVRVPPPHLFLERSRHHLGVELRSLFRDHDLEREVQQHVTELVPQCLGVVGLDRVIQLEGFLHEVGP